MSPRRGVVLLGLLGSASLAACATKADVQQLQTDVALFKAEAGRRDSARAAQLDEVIRMQRGIYDSLTAVGQTVSQAVGRLKGDFAADLYNIQQQLVQLQELTGQSQQAVTRLRTQLEARQEQLQAAIRSNDSAATAAATPSAGGSSASEMYATSVAQLERGSPSTARLGFQELIRTYPTDERVPDALYFIGQSFAADTPDSAAAYYQRVVNEYANSPHASGALYNLGLLAERRGDSAKAKERYRQVVDKYPQSNEAALAREKLKAPPR